MAQPFDEGAFRSWYAGHANRWGLNPNPDDPKHFYDYRSAYKAGASPDDTGHWPSDFKLEGHPRMYVKGVNTKTGRTMQEDMKDQMFPSGGNVEE
jgi:hypothetical protein